MARVCMGIFTTALRNKKISQILTKNTSPYFHSALLVIWPLTTLKGTHLSELSILRFSTYIRKALFLWGTTSKAHSERLQAAWSWGKEQTNAFEALKEALSGAPALAWLRLDAPTCVISDASPVGLGAIPQQDKGTVERILIVYISRSLTLTERRLTLTQQISYRLYHPSKIIFPILVSFVKTTQDLFSHQICMSDLQTIVLVFPNYAEIYASTIYYGLSVSRNSSLPVRFHLQTSSMRYQHVYAVYNPHWFLITDANHCYL